MGPISFFQWFISHDQLLFYYPPNNRHHYYFIGEKWKLIVFFIFKKERLFIFFVLSSKYALFCRFAQIEAKFFMETSI